MILREADVRIVAEFLSVPVSEVPKALSEMSDDVYKYLEELFERYVGDGND